MSLEKKADMKKRGGDMRGNSSNMINWVKCPPMVLDSLEKGKATQDPGLENSMDCICI